VDPTLITNPLHADAWTLDPALVMLNHGSFGACPRPILALQDKLRAAMEARPVEFLVQSLPPLLDASRECLAAWLGADADDLVFVPNVTTAVNAVLRSLRFQPGDEILLTNHDYNACRNVVQCVAAQQGARVVTARIETPIAAPGAVVEAVLAAVTEGTRLAVLDHVTSPTAIVFPIEELVRRLAERGIDTLVDGAHAPGMLPLDLRRLGAAYYGGNLHKWLCAPKGAGFLHVRCDRQSEILPPVISHGYNTPRVGRSRLHDLFDWPGTTDPTPWLCVGHAIEFLNTLIDGGLPALMKRNHELAVRVRRMLCQRLPVAPLCPEEMLGSMAAVRLPADGPAVPEESGPGGQHRLNRMLRAEHGIEVPVYRWPAPQATELSAPAAVLRISAQAYNGFAQYEQLAAVLERLL
jgi:isopenicillin-N epimerase